MIIENRDDAVNAFSFIFHDRFVKAVINFHLFSLYMKRKRKNDKISRTDLNDFFSTRRVNIYCLYIQNLKNSLFPLFIYKKD